MAAWVDDKPEAISEDVCPGQSSLATHMGTARLAERRETEARMERNSLICATADRLFRYVLNNLKVQENGGRSL